MEIAFLHTGDPRHGVNRLGRLVARALGAHGRAVVREHDWQPGRAPWLFPRKAEAVASALRGAQVVYLQLALHDPTWSSLPRLLFLFWFLGRCRPARIALMLHDFGRLVDADPLGPRDSFRLLRWKARALVLTLLKRRVDVFFVCAKHEADAVRPFLGEARLEAVPHLVETRGPQPSVSQARLKLGLGDRRVLTLLGFVYPGKGHELVVECLPRLRDDVVVVFAGGTLTPAQDALKQRLVARAAALGASSKLRVTDYLDESKGEVEPYLAATDLALAPFRAPSASSTLSTWLAVGKPILAFDSPLMREYHAMAPGAIALFGTWKPESLCEAIERFFASDRASGDAARASLRQRLAPQRIADAHVAVLECLVEQPPISGAM